MHLVDQDHWVYMKDLYKASDLLIRTPDSN